MKTTRHALFLLALGILTLLPQKASAQSLRASLSHYTTDDGLSSNAIACIRQDDFGYIWVATWNGLSRFDGYQFYNYKTGNGSHIPGLHNRVYDVCIDLNQNVWLQMYDQRVFVVDRHRDVIIDPFKGMTDSEDYKLGAPLFLTTAGDVLAYIDDVGIYKLRLDQGQVDAQLITTAGLDITCMAEGYHNDIWVGTPKGVHRVSISNLAIEREALFEDEQITDLYSNGFNVWVGCKSGRILLFSYGQEPKTLREATGNAVLSVFVDSHEGIWFADSRSGASRLDPTTLAESHFEQRVPIPQHDSFGGHFSEVGGTVWVSMNHGGYGYYNWETNEVEYFHNDPVNPWNLSNTINAELALEEGVVFESTVRRGLEKLDIQKSTISRTRLVAEDDAMGNEVRALYYDMKQRLLLMGNKKGTLYITASNGQQQTITHDSHGDPIGRLYGISKDSKGNYWVCSKDNGLFRMTANVGGGYYIERFSHDDNNKWSLSSNAAYMAVEDKLGNIWVATYGGGVNLMVKNKSGQTLFLHPGNEMKSYPARSYRKVRTICADKEGNVWVGTTDGILIMNYKNGKLGIKRVENSEEQPDKILMSNDIVCLACDKSGQMWVGTNGGGLSFTSGHDSKGNWLFGTFSSQDGLPSEEIRGITFDQQDNVWFATDHILCSYNRQKGIFTTFSNLDGVDDTMCSEAAAVVTADGKILFGTFDGYYTVDRKKLTTDNASLLKLHITDFWLNDELQSPRLTSTFDYYVPDARSVKLPSHNNEFAFRFTAMNYQLQHRIHYQYMLDGYDAEWQNADKDRTARYTSLPTGTYRFRVKAFLLESPDKYDMREIEVVVPPYFIFSSGAIWLYMVLAATLALTLMFWRQRKLAEHYGSDIGGATAGQPSMADFFKSLFAELVSLLHLKHKKPTKETDDYELIS